TLRGLMAHKVRLIATALSVLLGVAFMSGTQVLTSSISASFDKVFSDVYASIDVVVRSSNKVETPFGSQRTRISESVLPTVTGVPGVEAAEGQVVGQIKVLDKDNKPLVAAQGPPNFGLNWLTSSSLNGWKVVDGVAPTQSSDILLDAKTAKDGHYAVGDTVNVSVTKGVQSFTLVGIAKFGKLDTWGGAQAALFTTSTIQALVGEPGMYDWISIAGKDGESQQQLANTVSKAIPPGTEAITGKEFTAESQDAFQKIIGIFSTFLLVFALIALFVGSFIIYNTFSIIVAQRTKELALLRALGASRGQILRSIILEAFFVGLTASIIGVGCGVLLAIGLNKLMQTIGFSGPDTPIVIPPVAVVVSLLVGTLITLVSAVFPARRAATVPPIAAMRDVAVDRTGTSKRRVVTGLVLLAVGAFMLWYGLNGNSDSGLQIIGGGAFFVFISLTVIGPVIATPFASVLGWPLQKASRITGRLARENAMRNPRRTSTTASALMIGIGLVGFIAVTAQSIKASTVDAINQSVTGQYVVTTEGFGSTALPQSLADELTAVPGVQVASGISGTFGDVMGRSKVLLAVDPASITQVIKFTDVQGSFSSLGIGQIAASEQLAKDKHLSLGQIIDATFLKGGPTTLVLSSIYKTEFPTQGSGWIISTDQFNTVVPPAQQTYSAIYVKLKDTSTTGVNAALPGLKAVTDTVPGAKLQNLTEYKKAQTDQVNQFLKIVYVLLALALIIAIVGVVNTLLLSVYERTRELGLLRAVGMSRRQVRSTIRLESVIISLMGTLIGLVIGIVFGWALVTALADQGITSFAIPWTQLVIIVIIAILAGVGAALYPARRAARLDVLRAISSD
ncbi:MAG: FtsX-like permease family protein, partial [Actinobacteria bacterium]|nr:FtsX-like permease family protein [Actinomycetota bacterium]